MTLVVVGYEGRIGQLGVTWSTPILRDGNELLNPTTGDRVVEKDIDDLSATLTYIDEPIVVPDEVEIHGLVLYVMARKHAISKYLRPESGIGGGIVGIGRSKNIAYYLFTRAGFDRFVRAKCTIIAREALNEAASETRQDLIDRGLVLDPYDPELNALNVAFSDEDVRDRIIRLARAKLKHTPALYRFEKFYQALAGALGNIPVRAVIKYEGGIARSGGMNVKYGEEFFHRVGQVHPTISREVQSEFPCLPIPPPPHVSEMRARSAEFHFTIQIVGESLGQRIARYMELQKIDDTLRGNIPEKLQSAHEFMEDVRHIVHLDQDTELRHGLITVDDEQSVAALEPAVFNKSPRHHDSTSVLLKIVGVQSGGLNDLSKVEVRFTPAVRRVFDVSDSESVGIDHIRGGASYLTAGTYDVRCDRSAPEKAWSLISVGALWATGHTEYITHIPSSFIPGAFLRLEEPMLLSRSGAVLNSPMGSIADVDGGQKMDKISDMHRFLKEWTRLCSVVEAKQTEYSPARWVFPSRIVATPIDRIIAAVVYLGGEAKIKRVLATIAELFGVDVRDNNTRRDIRANQELVFIQEDSVSVHVTELGLKHGTAWLKSGAYRQA